MPSLVVTKVPAKSKGTVQLRLNLFKPWKARVSFYGEGEYFLGYFATEEEAKQREQEFRDSARK